MNGFAGREGRREGEMGWCQRAPNNESIPPASQQRARYGKSRFEPRQLTALTVVVMSRVIFNLVLSRTHLRSARLKCGFRAECNVLIWNNARLRAVRRTDFFCVFCLLLDREPPLPIWRPKSDCSRFCSRYEMAGWVSMKGCSNMHRLCSYTLHDCLFGLICAQWRSKYVSRAVSPTQAQHYVPLYAHFNF